MIATAIAPAIRPLLRGLFGTGGTANAARDIYAILVVGVQTTLMLLLGPSIAAGSITLEREQQTWNALLLSRLSAREIVAGKYVVALIAPLLMLLVFAPLDLCAAYRGQVPLGVVLISGVMLVAGSLFYTAFALYCSWAQRRTHQASAAAFGGVATMAVGTGLLFVLWAVAVSTGRRDPEPENFVPMWLNPYMPLVMAISPDDRNYVPAIVNITFCLLGTLILWTAMTRRLNHGPGELEQ